MQRTVTLLPRFLAFLLVISTLSPARAQGPGSALFFDGVNDFVSIANDGDFNFNPEFTVEAWVKPTSLVAGGFRGIVRGAFGDPPASGGAWTLHLDDDDASNWGMSVSTPLTDSAKSGAGGLTAGAWQHIAGTFDGEIVRIYRNGTLVSSKTHPNPGTPSEPVKVLIGIWQLSFRGYIDEVRIWSHARTGTQIDRYRSCILGGDERGLVGYWRFNEGSGQIARDSSIAENHGRLGSLAAADSADPKWVDSDAPIDCDVSQSPFRRGDANLDAKHNVSDVVAILESLFGGAGDLPCSDAADANDDGRLDQSDAIYMLGFLFLGKSTALPEPFPGCGADTTPDRLDCDANSLSCIRIPVPLF